MASQTPTARTATRLTLVATVLAALTLSLIAFAGPVLGASVTGTSVKANATCKSLGFSNAFEIKQNDIHNGATDYDTVWGTLTVTGDAEKPNTLHISFTSPDFYVRAVIVKGEGNNNTLAYNYAAPGSVADTNLTAGGTTHIGRLRFCFGGSVAGATPGEGGSGALFESNGVSPLPTVAFGLILLSSLGALAFANVKTARRRS